MRSLLMSVLLVSSLALTAVFPHEVQAQSAAGTPDYAQSYTVPGEWSHYYYGAPYYNWRGHEQWRHHNWQWSEGRSFNPGYRYYSYPQYGTQFNGGGYYYFAPGYYYPRPRQ
jgi:hypothetical protein